MEQYLGRELTPRLNAALGSLPVVVVSGPRQVGKTTLIRRSPALARRRWLNLDDFATLEALRAHPRSLLAEADAVTVDEVQRLPELLVEIKRLVDEERHPGRFLLSGSANLALLEAVTESLAGRAIYLELSGFSRRERRAEVGTPPLLTRLLEGLATSTGERVDESEVLLGGMPPVCLGQVADPALWFEGYVQTYLERDVRAMARVGDWAAYHRVLRLLALRTGQLLNLSELARDAGVDHATATRYVSLLEASFVIRRVPPWLGNRTGRLVKSPKVYLMDSGLAAWLCGADDIAPGRGEALRGPLFETWVASNIASIVSTHWPRARVHFWAVQSRYEVDFVIEAPGEVIAIEVKAAERWSDRDLRGLRRFLELTPTCTAAVLAHNGDRVAQLGERLFAVPLSVLLA